MNLESFKNKVLQTLAQIGIDVKSKANDSEVVKSVKTSDGEELKDAEGNVVLPESTSGGDGSFTEDSLSQALGYFIPPVIDEYFWNVGDSKTFPLTKPIHSKVACSVNGQTLRTSQYAVDEEASTFTITDDLPQSENSIQFIYLRKYETPFTYEPETVDFMTATATPNDSTMTVHGRTGSETWDYFDSLIKRAKNDGSWGNVKAWFPMLGGTVAKHKLSVINNDLYEMVFEGGWTIDANGNQGNGTDNLAYPLDNPLTHGGNIGLTIGYNTGGNLSFIVGSHGGNDGGRYHIVNYDGELAVDFNHGDTSDFPRLGAFGTRGIVTTGYYGDNGVVLKDGVELYNAPLASNRYDYFDVVSIGYGARVSADSDNIPYHSTVRLTSWLFHDGDPNHLPLYNQLVQDWENFLNR